MMCEAAQCMLIVCDYKVLPCGKAGSTIRSDIYCIGLWWCDGLDIDIAHA